MYHTQDCFQALSKPSKKHAGLVERWNKLNLSTFCTLMKLQSQLWALAQSPLLQGKILQVAEHFVRWKGLGQCKLRHDAQSMQGISMI